MKTAYRVTALALVCMAILGSGQLVGLWELFTIVLLCDLGAMVLGVMWAAAVARSEARISGRYDLDFMAAMYRLDRPAALESYRSRGLHLGRRK